MNPSLFASRGFTAAGFAAAAAFFTMIGVVFRFTLSMVCERVGQLGIAARIGCLFAGNAVASVASGRLQHRFGSARVVLGALLVATAGLTDLQWADASTDLTGLAWRLALVGAGCGTVVAAATTLAVQSAQGPLAAMAGTGNNVIRRLGGALGAAVIGGILTSHLPPRGRRQLGDSATRLHPRASRGPGPDHCGLRRLPTHPHEPRTAHRRGDSMSTSTHHLHVGEIGDLEVSVSRRGEGHPVLLLHGGGGPNTVNPWADRLAAAHSAHVFTPVHPGFAGTSRPRSLNSIRALAAVYVALLDDLDLDDVTVVGNSIGGWVAAEVALLHPTRVSGYVLVDAVGIEVSGHPVADFFSLTPADLARLSYADPTSYGIDPATLSPEARAAMAANRSTLEIYGGRTMQDPGLTERLTEIQDPTLVVWGEADRVGDPDYGRAYAAAIPGSSYVLLEDAGHLPQVETPDALIELVWGFADTHARLRPPAACERRAGAATAASTAAGGSWTPDCEGD